MHCRFRSPAAPILPRLRSLLLAVGAALLAAGVPACADAQQVDALTTSAGNFARDRNIAVIDRPHPELEPTGIDVGTFRLLPRVDLSAIYVDNIFATKNDRQGDAVGIVDPSFKLLSNWSRNRLALGGDAAIVRYASLTSQKVETYDVNAAGQYDISHALLVRANVDYGRRAEVRTDIGVPNNSATPILFDTLLANALAQWESSRFKLVGSGTVTTIRYQDNETRDGAPLPQGYRDRNLHQETVRGEYALTPDLSLLAQGTLTQARYTKPELSTIDRSSNRQELLGGVSFEYGLIRAEAGLGYIRLQRKDPSIPNYSGIGGRVQVEYFPTQLTTVTLRVARTIEDAGLVTTPTYVRAVASLRADHELLRNLVLTVSGEYSDNNYELANRRERRAELFARATYTVNRHLTLSGRYGHIDSSATPAGTGKSFAANQLSLTASLKM